MILTLFWCAALLLDWNGRIQDLSLLMPSVFRGSHPLGNYRYEWDWSIESRTVFCWSLVNLVVSFLFEVWRQWTRVERLSFLLNMVLSYLGLVSTPQCLDFSHPPVLYCTVLYLTVSYATYPILSCLIHLCLSCACGCPLLLVTPPKLHLISFPFLAVPYTNNTTNKIK